MPFLSVNGKKERRTWICQQLPELDSLVLHSFVTLFTVLALPSHILLVYHPRCCFTDTCFPYYI